MERDCIGTLQDVSFIVFFKRGPLVPSLLVRRPVSPETRWSGGTLVQKPVSLKASWSKDPHQTTLNNTVVLTLTLNITLSLTVTLTQSLTLSFLINWAFGPKGLRTNKTLDHRTLEVRFAGSN